MKKLILTLAMVLVASTSIVEARPMNNNHNGRQPTKISRHGPSKINNSHHRPSHSVRPTHHRRPASVHVVRPVHPIYVQKPVQHVQVIETNHNCGYGCGHSSHRVVEEVYVSPTYSQGSSFFIRNKNFAFGLSNFLW